MIAASPSWFRLWRAPLDWLHLGFPAGRVEPGAAVSDGGHVGVRGVRVAGDVGPLPLLKFAADTGAQAMQSLLADELASPAPPDKLDALDVVIIGAGPAGIAAALEAKAAGRRFTVLDARGALSTIRDFPAQKPIYTYPAEMTPAGALHIEGDTREALLAALEKQRVSAAIEVTIARATRLAPGAGGVAVHVQNPDGTARVIKARAAIVAIGRAGDARRLGVPGDTGPTDQHERVAHRLLDPATHADDAVVVVGGGDSAVEAAVALHAAGARTTLVYRGAELSRPKPENRAALERARAAGLVLRMRTDVTAVDDRGVHVQTRDAAGGPDVLPADRVFALLGRAPPLEFLRQSGLPVRGDRGWRFWTSLVAILAIAVAVYHGKTDSAVFPLYAWLKKANTFPFSLAPAKDAVGLGAILARSAASPGFWYSAAYSLLVFGFGLRRIARRRTPYITRQTWLLTAIQVGPLFLLPYVLLPWLGSLGVFDTGSLGAIADALFPRTEWDLHGREYWRSLGFILAWPLFFWNVFTDQPMWAWLAISGVQTFVVIPLLVRRYGKGAYCGFICSCGALAETLGDAHRHKMPKGRAAQWLNLAGVVFLVAALALLALRVYSWAVPSSWAQGAYMAALHGKTVRWAALPWPLPALSYVWIVDLFFAGIVGVGLYFHFSGRTWCRFFCPLASLMNMYTRAFSRFRIFADKKRCISCNQCTTVCHQGIDVMHFAARGAPMNDPQCVRCSACVQTCPTGTLRFGRLDAAGAPVYDKTPANLVHIGGRPLSRRQNG